MTPTTEAEKIVAALNALNRTLPEPAHATQLLKVSWLLQTPTSPFQPLSLQDVLYIILPPDRVHMPSTLSMEVHMHDVVHIFPSGRCPS
jgi:hypothetical protein